MSHERQPDESVPRPGEGEEPGEAGTGRGDGDSAEGDESPVAAAPALVRLAAGVWWRTAEWYVAGVRRVLGVASPPAAGSAERRAAERERGGRSADPNSLRDRGAELLRRSADVTYEERMHPAYERILEALAPDEARILRLLARRGPQPAVDVRTARPFGVGSQLVEPGLSMIGAEAGCRHVDRVNAYLNNLHRLGLVWFSREPIRDPLRYQVLEAQPEVDEALARAGRGRTVRRSIHLTPFGEDFCAVCLPPELDEPALGEAGQSPEGRPDTTAGQEKAAKYGDVLREPLASRKEPIGIR